MTTDDAKIGSNTGYFEFLSITKSSFWVNLNSLLVKNEIVSTDGGETFFEVKDEVILGLYFFQNDFKIYHHRKVVNIFDILSKIGGLGTSLLAAAGVLGSFYNSYVYAMHFVHLLYFVREFKIEDDILDDNDNLRLSTNNKLLTENSQI